MIFDIFSKFPSLIEDYKVKKYRLYGISYELIIEIKLKDKSQLFIKDYLFLDGKRKYSFHWQNIQGDCIFRWDNVPHFQDISTFPFHKHKGKDESIEESEVMNLEKVLQFIKNQIID
jgi:hypothetical protein